MAQLTLTVLVGLPGSGKSTWARKNLTNEVFVSPDEIRYNQFHVQFEKKIEPEVWKVVFALLEAHLKLGESVVIDATNLTVSRRKRFIQLAKKLNASARAVFVNTPLSKCLKQNRQRRQFEHVSDKLIIEMAHQLVKPSKGEGFDKVLEIRNGVAKEKKVV